VRWRGREKDAHSPPLLGGVGDVTTGNESVGVRAESSSNSRVDAPGFNKATSHEGSFDALYSVYSNRIMLEQIVMGAQLRVGGWGLLHGSVIVGELNTSFVGTES
jgi:hypothetical protein